VRRLRRTAPGSRGNDVARDPIAPLRWSIAHLNDASDASLKACTSCVGWTVQDAMYFGGEDLVRRQGKDAARACRRSSRASGSAFRSAAARRASRRVVQPVHVAAVVRRRQTVVGTPIRSAEETPDRMTALRLLHARQRVVLVRRRRARSLEAGKLADLAVLSADYLTVRRKRSAS